MAESSSEYIQRRMRNRNPNHISSLKKLKRARRKAAAMDKGDMDSDDNFVEAVNCRLIDIDENESYTRHLHPTKGIRFISDKRYPLLYLSKPILWKIIGDNIAKFTKRYAHLEGNI